MKQEWDVDMMEPVMTPYGKGTCMGYRESDGMHVVLLSSFAATLYAKPSELDFCFGAAQGAKIQDHKCSATTASLTASGSLEEEELICFTAYGHGTVLEARRDEHEIHKVQLGFGVLYAPKESLLIVPAPPSCIPPPLPNEQLESVPIATSPSSSENDDDEEARRKEAAKLKLLQMEFQVTCKDLGCIVDRRSHRLTRCVACKAAQQAARDAWEHEQEALREEKQESMGAKKKKNSRRRSSASSGKRLDSSSHSASSTLAGVTLENPLTRTSSGHPKKKPSQRSIPLKASPCLICGIPFCKSHSCSSFQREGGIVVCQECIQLFSVHDFVTECVTSTQICPEDSIQRMVDTYGRAMTLLERAAPFLPHVCRALTKKSAARRLLFGSGGGNEDSAASLLVLQQSNVKPAQLANRILALYGMVESILLTTSALRYVILQDDSGVNADCVIRELSLHNESSSSSFLNSKVSTPTKQKTTSDTHRVLQVTDTALPALSTKATIAAIRAGNSSQKALLLQSVYEKLTGQSTESEKTVTLPSMQVLQSECAHYVEILYRSERIMTIEEVTDMLTEYDKHRLAQEEFIKSQEVGSPAVATKKKPVAAVSVTATITPLANSLVSIKPSNFRFPSMNQIKDPSMDDTQDTTPLYGSDESAGSGGSAGGDEADEIEFEYPADDEETAAEEVKNTLRLVDPNSQSMFDRVGQDEDVMEEMMEMEDVDLLQDDDLDDETDATSLTAASERDLEQGSSSPDSTKELVARRLDFNYYFDSDEDLEMADSLDELEEVVAGGRFPLSFQQRRQEAAEERKRRQEAEDAARLGALEASPDAVVDESASSKRRSLGQFLFGRRSTSKAAAVKMTTTGDVSDVESASEADTDSLFERIGTAGATPSSVSGSRPSLLSRLSSRRTQPQETQ